LLDELKSILEEMVRHFPDTSRPQILVEHELRRVPKIEATNEAQLKDVIVLLPLKAALSAPSFSKRFGKHQPRKYEFEQAINQLIDSLVSWYRSQNLEDDVRIWRHFLRLRIQRAVSIWGLSSFSSGQAELLSREVTWAAGTASEEIYFHDDGKLVSLGIRKYTHKEKNSLSPYEGFVSDSAIKNGIIQCLNQVADISKTIRSPNHLFLYVSWKGDKQDFPDRFVEQELQRIMDKRYASLSSSIFLHISAGESSGDFQSSLNPLQRHAFKRIQGPHHILVSKIAGFEWGPILQGWLELIKPNQCPEPTVEISQFEHDVKSSVRKFAIACTSSVWTGDWKNSIDISTEQINDRSI
jgi:hypothetical protein